MADILQPETLTQLPTVDTILFAVGYDRAAGVPIDKVYVGGLQNLLDALPDASGSLVYISSTGVYAQNDGGWVNEESPCEPVREGGRACLAAEQLLTRHQRGHGATILRLAGIYGPDRLPRSDDLLAGKTIPAPADGYLNLIHVDDAAGIVVAAAERSGDLRVYLVVDGHSTTRREYLTELARQLDAPPPRFADAEPAGAPPARGTTSKRIRNDRLLDELGATLKYPSYREGLARILADQRL